MDEVGARVHLKNIHVPRHIEDIEKQIEDIKKQKIWLSKINNTRKQPI
jgi:ATP-dependent Clp protease ATP-binding subunit ClpC